MRFPDRKHGGDNRYRCNAVIETFQVSVFDWVSRVAANACHGERNWFSNLGDNPQSPRWPAWPLRERPRHCIEVARARGARRVAPKIANPDSLQKANHLARTRRRPVVVPRSCESFVYLAPAHAGDHTANGRGCSLCKSTQTAGASTGRRRWRIGRATTATTTATEPNFIDLHFSFPFVLRCSRRISISVDKTKCLH